MSPRGIFTTVRILPWGVRKTIARGWVRSIRGSRIVIDTHGASMLVAIVLGFTGNTTYMYSCADRASVGAHATRSLEAACPTVMAPLLETAQYLDHLAHRHLGLEPS